MSRRLALGGLLLLGMVGAGLGAAPWLVARRLAAAGVQVETAGWSTEGLRLGGLVRGEDRVEEAVLGWDRRVRLRGAEVGLPGGGGGAGGGGAGTGFGMAGIPPGIVAVEVEGLIVRELPGVALAGELWPRRRLSGEGVEVEGDTLRAELATPWGTVRTEARPEGAGVRLVASCTDATLSDPELAPGPLLLPTVRFDGRWEGGRLKGVGRVGEVRASVEATGGPGAGEARFWLEGVPIADLYAVFAPLVPEVERATIGGELDAEGTLRWSPLTLDLEPRLTGLRVQGVLPAGYDRGPFRWTGRDAEGGPVLRTSGEGTPAWTPLAAMGDVLPQAVIAAEDAGFASHRGYDLRGMLDADADNETRGEVWRGGSTLTQQLAKNLFLDPSRTYQRKLRELLYAVELEEDLGKARILELYLNVVEWGPGFWGAAQASETYFLKRPSGLLPEEAAWLASILPRPRSAWREEYLADRPNPGRVRAVLDNMRGLSPEVREAAKARPVRLVPPP